MILINGQRYECEPAVEAYVKKLTANRADLMRINQQLEEELKERNQKNLDLQEEFYKQGAKIGALKAENAQLEEKWQKATGVIATDSLPSRAELYKIKMMCLNHTVCETCEYIGSFGQCGLKGLPEDWKFGGVNNEN